MLNDFISLLFPDYCLSCSKSLIKAEKFLCTKCQYRLPLLGKDEYKELINPRFYGKVRIDQVFGYLKFVKGGMAQKIIYGLKYDDHKEWGTYFGLKMGDKMLENLGKIEYDLVIPVPLHSKRLRSRGYNQSELLAEAISQKIEVIMYSDAVSRKIYTETSTRKNRKERVQNPEEVFAVELPEMVCDKKILIVDDVITTGSTIEALANKLYMAGAEKIGIAGLAIAV